MDNALSFCADRRRDGPFTFGRQLLRALLDGDRPWRHPKEDLALAFVDPNPSIPDEAAPLPLRTPRTHRIQHLPPRHLWFLCHAVAEVVEHHQPEETQIGVCHLAEADETDRLLVKALVERARFRLRPLPVRVVRREHAEPESAAPLSGPALLDAVRLGYYETAELCGRVVIDEADWPIDHEPDFHALLHAHTITLIAVGRPIESVWLSRVAARRWEEPALTAAAHTPLPCSTPISAAPPS